MTTGISVVLFLAVVVIVLIAIRMPMGYALGIAFGVTTPTEAGVVAVIYAIILGIVYRQLDWKNMKTMLVGTAKQVGSVLFILAGARLFSYIMTLQRVPTVLTVPILGPMLASYGVDPVHFGAVSYTHLTLPTKRIV